MVTLFCRRLNSDDEGDRPVKALYERVSRVWIKLASESISGDRNRELLAELAASPLAQLVPHLSMTLRGFTTSDGAETRKVLCDVYDAARREILRALVAPEDVDQFVRALACADNVLRLLEQVNRILSTEESPE